MANNELGQRGLDLLIAEMLGDVGRLHDSVEQVKAGIPKMAQDIGGAASEAANNLAQKTEDLSRTTADLMEVVSAIKVVVNDTHAHTRNAFAKIEPVITESGRHLNMLTGHTGKMVSTLERTNKDYQTIAGILQAKINELNAIQPARIGLNWITAVIGGVMVVSAAAGFFAGQNFNSPASRFAALNDVPSLLECRTGKIASDAKGNPVCIPGAQQAWRLPDTAQGK